MENTNTYKCPVCGTVFVETLSPLEGLSLYSCPNGGCPIRSASVLTLDEVKRLTGTARLAGTLKGIADFSKTNPGRGFTCGKMAEKALAEC